jgi:methylenetetrahydrofolate dehydrogenase (NADP+)/methenyltetrahydrofolate cyclohydrolase
MPAKIADGKGIAEAVRKDCRQRIERLEGTYGRVPGLAVIVVGDDPASAGYVRNKIAACHDVGICVEEIRHPDAITQSALIDTIKTYSAKPNIDGVLLQLPLPRRFDLGLAIGAIDAEKDVDGLHLYGVEDLVKGYSTLPPCTPHGVMCLLEHEGVVTAGRNAVVVGVSATASKPMALMLMQREATVAVCHPKTPNLTEFTRLADILVVAAGQPKLITKSMIKRGAIVIDVGVKRLANGRWFGDCDFQGVRDKAAYLTPVPGGIGPVTEIMFLVNTINTAERALRNRDKEERLVIAA